MRLIKSYKLPLLIIAALVIAGLIVLGVFIFNNINGGDKTDLTNKGPLYETVLPDGKPIDKLGGWQRVSPTGSDPVYAYSDTLDGVAISVSQQPLPESFKQNVESSVSELAKSYNATDQTNADGVKVYIGTSAKGPQTVIFTKNNILILIKSQAKINDASWVSYVKSLD